DEISLKQFFEQKYQAKKDEKWFIEQFVNAYVLYSNKSVPDQNMVLQYSKVLAEISEKKTLRLQELKSSLKLRHHVANAVEYDAIYKKEEGTILEELNKEYETMHNKFGTIFGVNLHDLTVQMGLSLVTDIGKINSVYYLRVKKEQLVKEILKKKILTEAFQTETVVKGLSKKIDITMQLDMEKTARANIKRDFTKDTYLGLLAKPQRGKTLSLIVDENQRNIFIKNNEFDVMTENDLQEKMNPKAEHNGKKVLAQSFEFIPFLDFLAPSHVSQLALFFGNSYYTDENDFGGMFDPANSDHIEKLRKDLTIKLKNSRVTMADILLVALGLQFRSESIEEKFQLLRKNKYKNLEDLLGDQFFAKSPSEIIKVISEFAHLEPELIAQNDLVVRLTMQEVKEQLPFLQEAFSQMEQNIKHTLREKIGCLGELSKIDIEANQAYGQFKKFLSMELFAKSILDYLEKAEDIYTVEGQRELLMASIKSSAVFKELKMAVINIQSEIKIVQQRIHAKNAAMARISEVQANRDNSDYADIRQSVKIDLFEDVNIAESEKQKILIDKLARQMFQEKYPKIALDPAEAILEEVKENENKIEKLQNKITIEKIHGSEEELQRLRDTVRMLEEENKLLKLELEALQKIQGEFEQNKAELAKNKEQIEQNQQDLEKHKLLLANAQNDLLCFKRMFEEQQEELILSTRYIEEQQEQL
ncbi:MAG TPA: hypothetical protein VFP93_02795, partial [Gammaproteobacteria bacterium]|nr:hypothetical protein [Gammaproteobacteria bacterium]